MLQTKPRENSSSPTLCSCRSLSHIKTQRHPREPLTPSCPHPDKTTTKRDNTDTLFRRHTLFVYTHLCHSGEGPPRSVSWMMAWRGGDSWCRDWPLQRAAISRLGSRQLLGQGRLLGGGLRQIQINGHAETLEDWIIGPVDRRANYTTYT